MTANNVPTPSIFISYRHSADSELAASRLAEDLRRHFAREQVFQDFVSIDPGADFVEALERGLEICAALLVVIGPNWLGVVDDKGRRRLDLADDWVRREVAESLRRPGVRVFPVLLDDARMPGVDDLPEELQPLTRRQAFPLTVRHWANDVAELVECLQRVPGLGRPSSENTPPAGRATKQEIQSPTKTVAAKDHSGGSEAAPEPGARERKTPDAGAPAAGATGKVEPPPTMPWKPLAAVGAVLAIALVWWFADNKGSEPQPQDPPAPAVTQPPTKESETQPAKAPVATAEPAPRPPATVKPGTAFRDCADCPEMVVIPAGGFMMGSAKGEAGRSDDEGPQHVVTIVRPFAVGKYEVTFDEWDACAGAGDCTFKPADAGWGRGRRPVINVSWDDAQAYVSWLAKKTGKSYRLLSEAEWEYAARAGKDTVYPWGNDKGSKRANFAGSGSQWSDKQTAPVGSFEPSAFGLHDMIGNVWEWTQDCWNERYTDAAPADGSPWLKGECGRRVVRGGSWSNPPEEARAAYRIRIEPGVRIDNAGFRLARAL